MLTNCLAACVHLTITVSQIERYIGRKASFFSYPLAFDAPVRGGGSRQNIATPFGMEKLEWCGYPIVKKFRRYVIRFDMIHERDRRTDGQTDGQSHRHRMTAIATPVHSIARQKYASLVLLTRISAVQGIPAPGIGTVLSVEVYILDVYRTITQWLPPNNVWVRFTSIIHRHTAMFQFRASVCLLNDLTVQPAAERYTRKIVATRCQILRLKCEDALYKCID